MNAVNSILHDGATPNNEGPGFRLERRPYAVCLGQAPLDNQKAFYKACREAFGENIHVAGELTEDGGCLVVMQSDRDDNTSTPKLEAMRKAASQFTGERPAFIAIQEHGIQPADLMLSHFRRKAGILSHALFGHYGANHVSATYITGFGAVIARNGRIGTPAFGDMRYETMLPHQIRTAIENNWPVILPFGVLEYHGEHLAIGMDTLGGDPDARSARAPGRHRHPAAVS